ncbi:MAG: serine/threonine protein kinase [Proteobacteria bacterium]|jgi:eukaryotic-like serine/threonine-protein kinase|nr:serine/threonine protein kinase [Pseudomonadota bacterium]
MSEGKEPTLAKEAKRAVDPLIGKVLAGRFKLLELIARGGMGKIYKAEQQPLGRLVALKVLDITDEGDGEFRKRFFLEASLCSRLSHPNTVRVFDYGCSEDGVYFFAMEYLEGATLHRLIHTEAPLAPERAVRLMRQICGALAEAHDRGIIHRDLKPANVFVTNHGEGIENEFIKVVDFGLVKELGLDSELSKTGHVLGSPMYMSPEQVNNDNVDQRTDVYAVGMILYALLTGKTAFKRGNMLAVLMAQLHKQPPSFAEVNPSVQVPEALEWIALTALEKDREKRFASMHELLKALKAVDKELRGEVRTVSLRLEEGLVVLPEGLEVSEEIRLSDMTTKRLARPDSDLPSSPTLVTPTLTGRITSSPTAAMGLFTFLGVVAGVLLVSVILGGAYTLFYANETPEQVQELPKVPPKVEMVTVSVRSDPPAAEVDREGVYLGVTPLKLRIPEGEVWMVEVKAPNYISRTVRLTTDQEDINITLDAVVKPTVVKPVVKQPGEPEEPPKEWVNEELRDPWEQ